MYNHNLKVMSYNLYIPFPRSLLFSSIPPLVLLSKFLFTHWSSYSSSLKSQRVNGPNSLCQCMSQSSDPSFLPQLTGLIHPQTLLIFPDPSFLLPSHWSSHPFVDLTLFIPTVQKSFKIRCLDQEKLYSSDVIVKLSVQAQIIAILRLRLHKE